LAPIIFYCLVKLSGLPVASSRGNILGSFVDQSIRRFCLAENAASSVVPAGCVINLSPAFDRKCVGPEGLKAFPLIH
jgi:hypothetical protein